METYKNCKIDYNKDTHTATCEIKHGSALYIGKAYCHSDDTDMENEKTGIEIAYRRALIKSMRASKSEEKAIIAALKQTYYSMKHSKKFNERSYENITLQRQIKLHEETLNELNELIEEYTTHLKSYIDDKDKFYKRIRFNRNKAKNN